MSIKMQKIILTAKQTNLKLKTILSSWINIVLILLLPLMALAFPIFFIPLTDCIGVVFTCTILLFSFITYERVTYSFKVSTLHSNSKLTSSDKWSSNLSTILVMIIINTAMIMFSIFTLSILANFDLLLDGFMSNKDNERYLIRKLPFLFIFYQTTIMVVVFYSLSYLLEKISSSSNTFYIFAITLFILAIIFGGAFNNYFKSSIDTGEGVMYPIFNAYEAKAIFPTSIFLPSLLLPFFANSQMISTCGWIPHYRLVGETWQLISPERWATFTPWVWEKTNIMNSLGSKYIGTAWKWNILWVVPYIHILGWFAIGRLLERK